MQHLRNMVAAEVETFLSMLATERKLSASTHNQVLSSSPGRPLYSTGMRLMERIRALATRAQARGVDRLAA